MEILEKLYIVSLVVAPVRKSIILGKEGAARSVLYDKVPKVILHRLRNCNKTVFKFCT
jgi:hypothetical protein